MSDKPVYSTSGKHKQETTTENQIHPGPCKMRLEKKGRGGKTVTVLFQLPWTPSEAKQWQKKIQSALSCGATFKNNQIELRGDLKDQVGAFFEKHNIKVIKAGG